MTRWIAIVGCATALALTTPMAIETAHAKSITCKAKTMDGKSKTWKCKKDETCCYGMLMNQGTCGKNKMCLMGM